MEKNTALCTDTDMDTITDMDADTQIGNHRARDSDTVDTNTRL